MEKNALWLFVRRLNLESVLFYLLLLFLPTQLGKHFWPNFSYVLGIRSDFLAPTIYLTDVFVAVLFIVIFLKNIRVFRIYIILLLIVLSFLLLSFIFWPGSKLLELYSIAKLLEITLLGWYVSKSLYPKYNLLTVVYLLSASTIVECILAILQFVNQHSMDGLWYWLGERHFTPQTIDIANMSLNGILILRPYATFSHPNELSGFLLIVSTLFLYMFLKLKNRNKLYFLFTYLLSSLTLFLTYGRSAIVAWVVALLFMIWQNTHVKHNKTTLAIVITAALLVGGLLLLTGNIWRFLSLSWTNETVSERLGLLSASFYLLSKYPLFGVGWGNFLPSLSMLRNYEINFYSLQPVHNIFVLSLVQSGVVGFGIFMSLFLKTVKHLADSFKNNKYSALFLLLLIEIAWTGSIDHYWLTLQQGQLIFAIIWGSCWSKYTS